MDTSMNAKKSYTKPDITIVKTDNALMEDWSEHELPGVWQTKQMDNSSAGFDEKATEETCGYLNFDKLWDDKLDNTDCKK